MKNKTIIGGVVVLVLLGAGYMLFSNNTFSLTNSVMGGLNINKGVKCVQNFDIGESGNSLTSTLYFYQNKMRYDTVMAEEVQGQKDMHSITDEEFTYVWGKSAIGSAFGGTNTGIKIANDSEENDYGLDFDTEELKQNSFNVPGLTCEKWFPDEKVFELPTEIEFMSLEEMMNPANLMQDFGITDLEVNSVGDMCAMCDLVPDETAKAECKKSCE